MYRSPIASVAAGALLAALAIAGCRPGGQVKGPSKRAPQTPLAPEAKPAKKVPPPPAVRPADVAESVIRLRPDFTFQEFVGGRQFFLRRHTIEAGPTPPKPELLGDSVSVRTAGELLFFEIVTVLDPGLRTERLATPEEREYALQVLEQDWLARNLEDHLAFHRNALRREKERGAALLDPRLSFSERALADLREERFALDADLASSRETAGYQAPPGRLEFLQKRIAHLDRRIAEETANLEVLKIERYLRDTRLERSTRR